jgi:hypothetical protein
MFGVKINEFDNSDGTIETFNKTFPQTPMGLARGEYVEIGDIAEFKYMSQGSPFIRELIFFDHNYNEIDRMNHDFGQNNFYNNDDFTANEKVKYKYYAKDFDGKVLAKAYSGKELADLLGCNESVIKRRLVKKITADSPTDHMFNVTRVEL